jgi:flagellar biogenesis protein FliO
MESTSGTTATSALPLSQAALGGGQAPALRRGAAESEFRTTKQSADAIPTATTTGITIPTAPATGTSSLTAIPAPLPSSSTFSPGPLVAGLLLAGLAVAALVMARRRGRIPRLVEIVESASLGPRRSLVVARLGDEILLLGSSEGGVTLLSTRPAAGLLRTQAPRESVFGPPLFGPSPSGPPPSTGRASQLLGLLSRLGSQLGFRPRTSSPPVFDTLLNESQEDVELRRKLAAGRAGTAGAPPPPPGGPSARQPPGRAGTSQPPGRAGACPPPRSLA